MSEYRLRVARVGINGKIDHETVRDITGMSITSEAQARQAASALIAGGAAQVIIQTRDAVPWADSGVVGEIPPPPTKCETCGQPLP